ncbi:MAG: DUF4159 domain-containing protein [Phycisphaeraceae bacterium]|nr:DUF4159 domain-containing protein [Phycisphaeraceae bacterium]
MNSMRLKTTVCAALLAGLATMPWWARAERGGGDRGASDVVACANLIYAGTRSSVCFSDKFLSTVARETHIQTARKFKPVKLSKDEIYKFPFAIMTGEGGFTMTASERKNLRRYLERGGFLLASAGCSSKQWDQSFRREISKVFPKRKLEKIGTDHEIFKTVFQIGALKTKGKDAVLEGLSIGGKIVLIYSSDGLNDTSTMHGCCCCGGNEILNAQKVNANILTYALLQ